MDKEDSSSEIEDVIISTSDENISGVTSLIGGGSEEEDDDSALELVHVKERFFYMNHVMRLAAAVHSLISLAMLIAYYHLKVMSRTCNCNYL